MLQLRPYQDALRVAISQAMKAGHRRVLATMATGAGKTAVATDITHRSLSRGFGPVWFLVHRRELMEQTALAFGRAGVDVGYVAAGYDLDPWRQAQVCLIGSLPRRMDKLTPPKLIVTDECQHAPSATYTSILNSLPQAWGVGLSATPERLDGKGLNDHFDTLVSGPSMRWLIDNGYLCDYRVFCPPSIDTQGMHTVAGDWNKKELETALRKSTIMGDAIREYQTHTPHTQAICRALSREDSYTLAEKFKAAGIVAAHLDARNTAIERAQIFGDFQRRELPILCNVELFSEGVDVVGVETVIDLRPTKSLTFAMQFWGRGTRPLYADGYDLSTKEGRLSAIAASSKPRFTILDHGGNVAQHGLPCDERAWSLEGRVKREVKKVYSCKKCFAAFAQSFRVCPECGFQIERVQSGRGSPEQIEGRLEELDKEKVRRKPVYQIGQRHARSLEDLIAHGRERGMKNPEGWAQHVWKARVAKRGAAA